MQQVRVSRRTTLNDDNLEHIQLHKLADDVLEDRSSTIGSINLKAVNAAPTGLLETSLDYEDEPLLYAPSHKPEFKILKAELDSILPTDAISHDNDTDTPNTNGIPTKTALPIGNKSSPLTGSTGDSINFTGNILMHFLLK